MTTCDKPGCAGDHLPGRCTGHHSDGSGHACKKWPIKGLPTCRSHGSGSPQARAAGERRELERQAEDQARKTLGTLGIVDDPSTLPVPQIAAELQLSAAKHLAGVRWLEQQVARVEVEAAPASPWLKMLAEARKSTDQLLVDLARLGIEMAAVRLEEEQGRLVVDVMERVLRRCDQLVLAQTGQRLLDPLDPQIRAIVRDELQTVVAA